MLALQHRSDLFDRVAVRRRRDFGGFVDLAERRWIADRSSELGFHGNGSCDLRHHLGSIGLRRGSVLGSRFGSAGRRIDRNEHVVPLLTHGNQAPIRYYYILRGHLSKCYEEKQ